MTENKNLDCKIVDERSVQEKYTPSQRDAVTFEGQNMLVSASAGSGKTFVMIERLIKLIVEQKVDADGVLCVTYTKMAAEEMKEKLVKAIIKQINEGKSPEIFRKVLAQIPTASISTFHSFCANLLRSYFYLLDLDPLFSVCDEIEAKQLKQRAIEQLFENLYESEDEEFLYLVRIFVKNRKDAKLKEYVQNIYEFSRYEEDPEKFLNLVASSSGEEQFDKIEKQLINIYERKFGLFIEQIDSKVIECLQVEIKKHADYLIELKGFLCSLLKIEDISEFCRQAINYKTIIYPKDRLNDPIQKGGRDEVTSLKKIICDYLDKIYEVCGGLDRQTLLADFISTDRAKKGIVSLVSQFGELYFDLKKQQNAVDFSDLEHLTYKLLSKSEDALSQVREKYKYVFADEYQDVNGIQEATLNLISNDNLFMVGDVKQSIYAFRGCNPDIFAQKYQRYQNRGGKTISLDTNFRSAPEVLKSVNNVFKDVISRDFGGVDYARNPMTASSLFKEGTGEVVFHQIEGEEQEVQKPEGVYDILKDALKDNVGETFLEGALVAEIIEKELGEQIYDGKLGEWRKVTLSDITVLTRTAKGYTADIVKQLIKSGIPVSSESGGDITEFPEIKLLIDVLKLIAFYADDVPLASVLKSAIGGVSQDELAQIRLAYNERATFYECVKNYINTKNDQLSKKLQTFESYFEGVRLLSEFTGAGEILTRILSDTGLSVEILSMPLGKMRLERVERFISESCSGGKKLSVIKFLERIERSEDKITLSAVAGDQTVRVMSMHASKGLEFPIVIIPGIAKTFNHMDITKEIFTDRKWGLDIKAYNEVDRTQRATVNRELIKQNIKSAQIMEEARIFYVAMTRAVSKLHLISTKPISKERSQLAIESASSFLAFLSSGDMKVQTHTAESLISNCKKELRPVLIGMGRKSLTDKIYDNLSFNYAYGEATTLPVKKAVTKLTDELSAPLKTVFLTDNYSAEFDEPIESQVIKREKNTPTGADIGTAYHRYLEVCDFSKDVDNELIRLLSCGDLTEEQAKLIDKDNLKKILKSSLFESLKGYTLYREHPFIVPFSAIELGVANTDETLLVQGVIDLLAIKGDSAVIVDYKYSKLKGGEEIKAKYYPQLDIYRKAVQNALNMKVERTVILNLRDYSQTEV